jgi:hypothetical protein
MMADADGDAAIMQSPATPAVKGSISVGGSDVVRPLAPGAGIRVGRAYGVEDEDCTIVFMPNKDARGRETYSRSVSCAD